MRKAKDSIEKVKTQFEKEKEKQKEYDAFQYGAKSWKKERQIIVKAEYNSKGSNTRFLVTNLDGTAQEIYEKSYCPRGIMEQKIGEQMDFFLERTSSHDWWKNQFRILLSALAYILVNGIRRIGIKGLKMSRVLCKTIRLRLLKIGAISLQNTRKIRFIFPRYFSDQNLFLQIAKRLAMN